MMKKPAKKRSNTKVLRRQAEVAAEHFLHERMECLHVRRAIRTKWQKVDFFGADLVGVLVTGAKVYCQVTTGGASAMSSRRAKLQEYSWHDSETVLLLNLVATASPGKGRRIKYWFRVEELSRENGGMWGEDVRLWEDWEEAYEVPREWFKKGDWS